MSSREILFLDPVFTHNIWGGTRLRTEFGYEVTGNDIGECWGISAHEKGDCEIAGGSYAGKRLSELWKEHPELFGFLNCSRFPLMVKIIDAREDLSVQVHPDNAYAKKHENGSFGKTECWYVLDCEKDAALVVGHNASSKEELERMVGNGLWEEFIREIPVKKGSFVQIDPGCVHAIKGGLLVYEVEQNSDITYRVYDYDRLSGGKPRELHIQKSIDVIRAPARPMEKCVTDASSVPKNQWCALVACDSYRVWKLALDESLVFEQPYPFLQLSVLEGEGTINGVFIKKGMHMILPSGFGRTELAGKMEVMASSVGNCQDTQ